MRAAEEAEFRQWAAGRQAALRRTAYLLCGDWHFAEDLVQETLTRMYRRWPALNDRGRVEAYARRVLTSAYVDERRRRSSTERPVAAVPDLPDALAGSGMAETATLRVTLLAALARMPRSQRAVLVLRYWEDLTQAQTAAVLGCSEGNVKSQASRGLLALRAELARVGVELAEGAGDTGDEPPERPGRTGSGRVSGAGTGDDLSGSAGGRTGPRMVGEAMVVGVRSVLACFVEVCATPRAAQVLS